VVRVRYRATTDRSYFSTVAVLEVAHNIHRREGAPEAERNQAAPAGDLTGMMEEGPVEGHTVRYCCSCCVSLQEEDPVEGHTVRYCCSCCVSLQEEDPVDGHMSRNAYQMCLDDHP